MDLPPFNYSSSSSSSSSSCLSSICLLFLSILPFNLVSYLPSIQPLSILPVNSFQLYYFTSSFLFSQFFYTLLSILFYRLHNSLFCLPSISFISTFNFYNLSLFSLSSILLSFSSVFVVIQTFQLSFSILVNSLLPFLPCLFLSFPFLSFPSL